MATNSPRPRLKTLTKVNLTAHDTKFFEIVEKTFNCLTPLSKFCIGIIDAVRKSQVGIFFHRGGTPKVRPLTNDQVTVMNDCYKVCRNYQKMEQDDGSFNIFSRSAASNDPNTKKTLKKLAAKLRRRNKKDLCNRQKKDEDIVRGWMSSLDKLFETFEILIRARAKLEDIIYAIDPDQRTNLWRIFKSAERGMLDKELAKFEELKKKLCQDAMEKRCSCGFFQPRTANCSDSDEPDDNVNSKLKLDECQCIDSGLNLEDLDEVTRDKVTCCDRFWKNAVSAAMADAKSKHQSEASECRKMVEGDGFEKSDPEDNEIKNETLPVENEDELIECQGLIPLPPDSDVGLLNDVISDVIRGSNRLKSQKKAVVFQVNPESTSLYKKTDFPSPDFFEALFSRVGVDGNGNTTGIVVCPTMFINEYAYKNERGSTIDRFLAAEIVFTAKRGVLNEILNEMKEAAADKITTDSKHDKIISEAVFLSRFDEDEELEVVCVEDRSTQTDFPLSDSDIEILDESVVPLCVRSPHVVVKERKVSLWYEPLKR